MKTIMSRRSSGLCLITHGYPTLAEIGNTGVMDVYAKPGDPVSFYPVCDWARENLFNVDDLKPLWAQQMEFYGRPLGEPFDLRRMT